MPFTTPYPGLRSVLIMDNCRIHQGEEVRALVEDMHCLSLHIVDSLFCLILSSLQADLLATLLSGLQSNRTSIFCGQVILASPQR
jgi:hypothetical protein